MHITLELDILQSFDYLSSIFRLSGQAPHPHPSLPPRQSGISRIPQCQRFLLRPHSTQIRLPAFPPSPFPVFRTPPSPTFSCPASVSGSSLSSVSAGCSTLSAVPASAAVCLDAKLFAVFGTQAHSARSAISE